MKDVQKELLVISTALSSLVKQVEKITEALEAEESGAVVPAKRARAAKKAKATVKKAKASAKKAAAKKQAPTVAAEQAPTTAASSETMLDSIFGMISRSRNGITVERLKKRTGLEARQVSNALYKLTKKGKIETISRGLYIKKKS
ncbi:conserved hypothetical protein [Desulfosarcina cetonica]|uniref:type IV toxin-antitoxin system AbiEi family antitoxin domain-containing protein n=1 Tax=Desulfosarcina cetonica TaxID=90730 RepID=UPI0006D23CBC|nr:type IV toxin-antitoxin system AbiEi family antitoxin domain-containing protein [Desulfosarcina cetonica]VTR63971.1 conserved hypothetical protein [Desulfosarcina cetonica]